jgi:hypothetical protein
MADVMRELMAQRRQMHQQMGQMGGMQGGCPAMHGAGGAAHPMPGRGAMQGMPCPMRQAGDSGGGS